MANQTEPLHRRTCSHCESLTFCWLWRLIEPGPRSYEILCLACVAEQDRTFTTLGAIQQAAAIVRGSAVTR